MSKKEKMNKAIYQALNNYNDGISDKIEEVICVQINSHTPSNIGEDSMEEWESVSGIATMRTSTSIENGKMSRVYNFDFAATIEYTDGKEFKCSISRLNKMY